MSPELTELIYYTTHNGAGGNKKIRSYSSDGLFRWEKSSVALIGIMSGDIILGKRSTDNQLIAWNSSGDEQWQAGNLGRPVCDEVGNIYTSNSVASSGDEFWGHLT